MLSYYVLKPKGQSRMDNAETLATLGKQDTGQEKNNTKPNVLDTTLHKHKER
jgi:hypothetical protein